MKFMVEYSTRSAPTYGQAIDNFDAVLRAFSTWSVPDGVTIAAFVAKVEAPGGYILLECDDAAVLARLVYQYMSWNDARIIPVIDIQEAASLYGDGIAWAKAATS
jgi:Protein of unknown function (DUF3303)